MALALKTRINTKALADAILKMENPVAVACADAITGVGLLAKDLGRAHIAQKTKGNKLKGSWAVKFFPGASKRIAEPSLNAAAFFYDKVEIVRVLEQGARIQGRPYLWIPLPSAPPKISKGRVTPKLLRGQGVDLHVLKGAGHKGHPLLGVRVGKAAAQRGSVSLGALRRSGGRKGRYSLPLFVGVPAVTIKKRLHLFKIVQGAAKHLAEFYDAALKAD